MTTESPYATTERPEVHSLVPRTALRILDVGCNDGGFGVWLQGDVSGRDVWGIEPNVAQAALARQTCAGVVTGLYPQALDQIDGEFDCITFNHVLEHMTDPWGALEQTRDRLTSGGCVIAVIPNIRYFPVLVNLAFRGRWDYQDTGQLDRTHLRFFTRASIITLFLNAHLHIDHLQPVNGFACVSHPLLSRIASRLFGDTTYGGFAIRAIRQ